MEERVTKVIEKRQLSTLYILNNEWKWKEDELEDTQVLEAGHTTDYEECLHHNRGC